MWLLKFLKLLFSRFTSSAILAGSSKLMVGNDSMGPGLQLVGVRFSNKGITWLQTSRNVDITWISNGHISVLREVTVTRSGTLVVQQVVCMLMWPCPDPRSRSRSRSFWVSENCTFLGLSPPPFWRGAQNWRLITIVWDLVYSFSEPYFWISSPFGGHVTSKIAKCWHRQNPQGFISALPEARSSWLWLHVGRNKPYMLAAMTVSPPSGAFLNRVLIAF